MSQVIWKSKTKKGQDMTIRYPLGSDVEAMCRYINTLSQEKTYIRFQGEEISLEEEKKYLDSHLEKIAKHEAVLLLVFVNQELVGVAGIEMQDKTERHVGVLGISIAQAFRGEGIGSVLMKVVIEEAIKNLNDLEIITLCVFSHNAVGKEMYKKFGFIEYGMLPMGIKLGNEYADHILMYKSVT